MGMAQQRDTRPASQQAGGEPENEPEKKSGGTPAEDAEIPASRSSNQARDEPIPASHDDDGRPEPGEKSPGPGAGATPAHG
jgi:hypothetical protein